jgi:long-chain-fatty-acid--[acyl-carrier-protein] ligase
MMKTLGFMLWFRYRIKIEGAEHLNKQTLKNPGGVLFLPNHPSYFIDPVLVPLTVFKTYPIRPMIVEYMYYLPGIHWIMRFLNSLPVPNFQTSSNSLKKKKTEKVFDEVVDGLRRGENFLIYPAGKVKYTQKEVVGGASGIQKILSEAPETNIVLVRIKGLWGSSFSRAILSKAPSLGEKFLWGLKIIFKNLIFFTPRREIIVSFEPAPADFPRLASRLELNRYLENWYNQPDGLSTTKELLPGDSLNLVSYSMWGEQYLPLHVQAQDNVLKNEDIKIPPAVRQKIYQKLGQLAEVDPSTIKSDMALDADLGMDSIDMAELAAFLQDEYELGVIPTAQMTSVNKLLAIAAKTVVLQDENQDEEQNLKKWFTPIPHQLTTIHAGETIHEVFLSVCDKLKNRPAVADDMAGILTYKQLKMRVLLVADYIRKQPGNTIGILLPASVGATILILATLLAGKIPIMINWTVGPRHLEAVVKLSGVKKVLTSWAFLDRLDNVNLDGVEELLVMMEDVRRTLSLKDKLLATLRSKYSVNSILKTFNSPRSGDDQAVLLFTSGTESLPKGVPLSHTNILANQRAAAELVELYSDDVMYGILPPFHAFGFTVSTLMALLAGIRVAFHPNPTEGKKLAKGMQKYGVTLLCGAPTFLKGIVRSAQPGQIETLRLCVTGAEKAPPELFDLFGQHGKRENIVEGYGITECAPVLTFNPPREPHIGVGRPLPGIDLLIVHPETYAPVAKGEQGLILARGPNIFKGYLNPGISSPFVTVDDKEWYKTGDLGYLDPSNYLIIAGRQKRFIKVGGEMVSLSAIEESILHMILEKESHSGEEGPLAAVCAKEQPGEKPRIYLFTRVNLTQEEANQYLRKSGFSNLVRLSQVIQMEEIPIMGTGKINYRLLEGEHLPKIEKLETTA